jgi:hypothetical protein
MKNNLKIATISVAVVAGLLVAYLGGYETARSTDSSTATAQVAPKSETPVLAQNTQPQSSGEQLVAEIAAIDPEDVDPASIDWAAIKQRYGITKNSFTDPMLMRWADLGGFTAKEIAAFNKLHVIPFNPKVDEVCFKRDIGIEGAGENGDGFVTSCDPIYESPEHEYANLDLDTLLELAETDAAAAVIASREAPDISSRLNLSLRAVVMSEKSGPLLDFIERNYRYITTSSDRPQQDIVNDYSTLLMLERVAEVLGDPRANPETARRGLQISLEDFRDYEATVKDVENNVAEVLKYMSEVQQETTGSTQIWELTNA